MIYQLLHFAFASTSVIFHCTGFGPWRFTMPRSADTPGCRRKLAQQWHPDNFATGDDAEKKKAEARFIDIAAAKEVLSDPGRRQTGRVAGHWAAADGARLIGIPWRLCQEAGETGWFP